mgnify:CR=1 FL=1
MLKQYERRNAAESEVIIMMTIIGLKRKNGTYQGKPYDNFFVDVLITGVNDPTVIAGGDIAEFKIKQEDFIMALTRNLGVLNDPNVKEAKDIVGLLFAPAFSKFQGVTTDFTLAVPEKKKG